MKRCVLVSILLIVLVSIAFSQVIQNDFINFDDDIYVTANSHLTESPLQALQWAFTTFTASNWHPLTWMSHRFDVALFGMNPRGHHLASLLFHITNALLLFWVLLRWTGAVWKSALTAALFGIHPLHVESVAWVAERKDLLSAFFFFLTLVMYRHYVDCKNGTRYLAMTFLFTLGLLSKPMLVSLPLLLLGLDYWPLGRYRFRERSGRPENSFKTLSSLLAEKIPLFLLAVLSVVMTWSAQSRGGSLKTLEEYPPAIRLGNACVSAVLYIYKMVWPKGLVIFYPHPGEDLSIAQTVLSAVLLAAVTTLAVRNARRTPVLIVGWFWYVITLLPVLGLVQVGVQAMADRYTYVPLIGLFLIMSWGADDLGKSWPYRRIAFGTAAVAVLLCLAAVTQFQVRTWRSSISVFEHALMFTKNNFVAHDNLAVALRRDGRTREAMRHTLVALRIRPDKEPGRYLRFGSALLEQGMQREAVEVLEKAVQLKPFDQTARRLLDSARAARVGESR